MTPPLVRNGEARRLFLHLQGLAFAPRRKLTGEGLLGLVEHLGFVQVDSINTVERAHHLILFARNQTYRPALLRALLERDASLFENWTHDAAIIPTRYFPFWRPRFARQRQVLRDRWRKWRRGGFEEASDQVLEQIRERGPVMARQLATDEHKSTSGWWDWHPSKTALEYLWRTGELAVARREGFQKVYDLTERVIPACHRRDEPATEAFVDWACRGALDRLGVATSGELAAFWGAISPAEAKAWCENRRGREIIEVRVEAADGTNPRPAFARADLSELLHDLPEAPRRIRAICPFDPLVRDRKRTERLFNFRFRIEVFVPAEKRQYGYYVFPLLEGDRLIGRIDMKHQREHGTLAVKGVWLEPGCKLTRQREQGLDAELDRLRRFVGAERVVRDNGCIKSIG